MTDTVGNFFDAIGPLFRALVRSAIGPELAGLRQKLDDTHKEIHSMSDTTTQIQADVSQMAADLKTITDAFTSQTSEIASLKAAASAQAANVPPSIQAMIDNLHATAQGMLASTSTATSQDAQASAPAAGDAAAGAQGAADSSTTVQTASGDTPADQAPATNALAAA